MLEVIGGLGADGPDGLSYPYLDGRPGRGGGTASASATDANTGLSATDTGAAAYAGSGGQGGNGANAGYSILYRVSFGPGDAAAGSAGGNAYASAATSRTSSATAISVAGAGGLSGTPGKTSTGAIGGLGADGGAGGFAGSSAKDFNSRLTATATSVATGGAGGLAYGARFAGGVGGAVGGNLCPTKAVAGSSALGALVTASVTQTGGAGGGGAWGADGGAGASSSLTNMVSGYSHAGALTLAQTAIGGRGGDSATGAGGTGAGAVSSLTFNDKLNSAQSAVLNAAVTAVGGGGGSGAKIGAGGSATATLVATGAHTVNATTVATGGSSGAVSGLATASTTVTGVTGVFGATAATSLRPGKLVETVSATAGGVVDGTSLANAVAGIGQPTPAFTTKGQAVSFLAGAPVAASTSAVLTANSKIKAGFGTSPVFFGVGELGGAHSASGRKSETVVSSFNETVDLTKLKPLQHLVVGLYSGTPVGGGFTSMTFDLYADGVDEIHQTFTTAAAAKVFFTNHAIDLGQLGSGALAASNLKLEAKLSITTSGAGSGFFGGVIIGDPPASGGGTATPSAFAQHMASMGASHAWLPATTNSVQHTSQPMLAVAARFA